tara:strand:- start:4550 stop:5626 length:1077 start_codon:yes stop_codon:yes gene_type:complete
MDLLSAVWMERSLNQSISALHVDAEGGILAGGWDGALKRWNAAGDVLWAASLPDRITTIVVHGERILATSGLHIVCVEHHSGQLVWSHPLEGSADALIVVEDAVYAVSSVYDIEHNDFIESAVWKYSLLGELEWTIRMDERPWVLVEHARLPWIGLGRPKCGFSSIEENGELTHHNSQADSPITCGTPALGSLLFGHADGTISDLKGSSLVKQTDAVESLSPLGDGFVTALENGTLTACNGSGEERWNSKGDPISTQSPGFHIGDEQTHWVARGAGQTDTIEMRQASKGVVLASSEIQSVTSMAYNSNHRFAVGCDDGRLVVWDSAMLERRMNDSSSATASQPKKSALQEKLRALRDR